MALMLLLGSWVKGRAWTVAIGYMISWLQGEFMIESNK